MSCVIKPALSLALLLAVYGCQSTGPSWDLPASVKSATVNGYPMAFVEKGSGPPLVLVHGAVNDYRYWQPQLDSLSSRYRVISVSLRHYYPEPWKGEGDSFSVEVQARDVAAFIERLGAGPVTLVGHSRGGSVVAGTAKLRPDLVKRLVLMEPSLLLLVPRPAGAGPDPAVVRAIKAGEMMKGGQMEAALEFYIDGINGAGAWKKRSDADRQLVRDNAWTILGGARHKEMVDCDDLGRLPMPVMFVESENGPAALRNILKAGVKCAPAAQHVMIPKAGHRMNRDNPAAFDAALTAFAGR